MAIVKPLVLASTGTIKEIAATDKFAAGNLPGGLTAYGTGSDGAGVISGNTTLTRDMYYDTLIVNSGIVLTTAGFRVFAKTSIQITGTVRNNGNNGSSQNPGSGAGSSSGTLRPGGGGGTGATTAANGGGATSLAAVGATLGAQGGNGGTDAATHTGGTSGSIVAYSAQGHRLDHYPHCVELTYIDAQQLGAAAGVKGFVPSSGGGGGASNGIGVGGGGGGGGGLILLVSPSITIDASGVIEAKGGTGANASGAVAAGGGGGGGGGAVVMVANSITNGGTITLTGGAGGTGIVGGNTGVTGSTGNSYQITF